jgi:hypothetical protein
MSLKLYCNRFTQFKYALVCSVSCPYRTRCRDFALFYDEQRESVDAIVEEYFASQQKMASAAQQPVRKLTRLAPIVSLRTLIRLEVKREMAEATYIWISKDDQAELLGLDEIIRRAERGAKAKHIYRVAQEMELRYQLVPRKRIEKARRDVAIEAERSAARRRSSRPTARPIALEQPATPLAAVPNHTGAAQTPVATPARRTRTRAAKVAGGR